MCKHQLKQGAHNSKEKTDSAISGTFIRFSQHDPFVILWVDKQYNYTGHKKEL
jgi:hypothetical protein